MWHVMFILCGILANGEQGCSPITEVEPTLHLTKEACEETLDHHAQGIIFQYLRDGATITSLKGGCVQGGQGV